MQMSCAIDFDGIRNGNEHSFSALFSDYAPLISSLVAKYIKDPSTEEDLRQEACIALYLAAMSFCEEGGTTFGLYAKVCIKNRLISCLRKYGRVDSLEAASEDIDAYYARTEPYSSEEADPLNMLIVGEDFLSLRRRIEGALTPYENAVFTRYAAGCSYREIARALGKDEKSVGNAVYRIKKKLKSLL